MSETGAQIVALLVTAVLVAATAWFTLRFLRRRGVGPAAITRRRQLFLAVLFTVLIVALTWFKHRGEPVDPFAVIFGLMIWTLMMFVLFRRPTRT